MEDVFVLPASSTQQRLWFLDKFSRAGAAYNVFAAFALRGPVRADLLEQSLNTVAARHEALRTAFATVGGTVTQVVSASAAVPFAVAPWPGATDNSDDEALSRELSAEASRPFDLATAPLLRAKLYVRDADHHVLMVTGHHSVIDGWSQRLLLEETAAVYNGLAAGTPVTLPPLAIQYGDFAIWEQEALESNAHAEGLAFWKQQLAGELPAFDLPRDRQRPLEASYRGHTLAFMLPADVADRLNELARAERASLFLVVLGAFATLLHRYTGTADIVIGSPIANRLRPELEACVGFFANTVVFRCDLSGTPSFRDLLGRLRQTSYGVFAHQDVPFDQVVRAAQPDRHQTQNPLFQVMLAAQKVPDNILPLAGVDVQALFVDNGTAKFDLLIEVLERSSGTEIHLEFSDDLFDRATTARIRAHFQNLLKAAAANPDGPIDEYPLMDPEERDLVMRGFNDTAVDYAPGTLVHTMIEAQVARTPSAIALECEGRTLTFEALDRQANQLAHHLRSLGVRANSFVAVCLERSPELIVALYAALKAGGAYVPMDPDYPVDRLQFMLEDAEAPVLITTSVLADRHHFRAPHIVLIDRQAQDWAALPATKPDEIVTPDDLAYMIYTSGSTGRPKGAPNAHRGIVNRLEWMFPYYGMNADTVIVQKTPISFDVSVPELFGSLATGGLMVLAKPGGHRDPAYMLDLIESRKITMAHFVPSMLRVFLEQGDLERARCLEHVSCTGEALAADLRDQFYERFSIPLHNLYGPTEAAVEVTFWDCREKSDAGTVPIGRPMSNTQIYILDAKGQPTPIGVPGELYIGGVQVGCGYHKRPELTAERFVPDPFSSDPNAKLYRTGDLCRWLSNGAIDFLGRLDHQIKLRGFRVELGEIEGTIQSHPSVREVVLTAIDDAANGKRLVAYVVAQQDEQQADQGNTSALKNEHVQEWEGVWDQIYTQRSHAEGPFNIIGWNNSYTRAPLTEEEMRDWLSCTVARIKALQPSRAWEIGCGTGSILFGVAPGCELYLGTDNSANVLTSLAPHVAAMPQVQLQRASAHDVPVGVEGRFDTVIINSVAQYFPGADYLLQVVDTAVSAVRDGGAVFLGDIRNLIQVEAFHASVQLYQAADSLAVAALKERVQRAVAQERELLLHPEFFAALPRRNPRISAVEIRTKRGKLETELVRYRYDVILHVGGTRTSAVAQDATAASGTDLQGLKRWMASIDAPSARLRDVIDARVLQDVRTAELLRSSDAPATVGELRRVLARRPAEGVNPEQVYALEADGPFAIEVIPAASGRPEAVDVVVRRKAAEAGADAAAADAASPSSAALRPLDASYWRQRANNPLQASFTRRLLPHLRSFLLERLPEYMVPGTFVFLEQIPLAPNGKVDRRALPAPDPPAPSGIASLPPRDDIEERLVAIWSELLGVPEIGRTDNFFELGGHSLLAAKLLTQMNKAFGTRLQLPSLFESGTIEHIARLIRGGDPVSQRAARCIAMLAPQGEAPPLYFIHPLGGVVSEYLALAKHMSPDQPFGGILVPLEDGVPAWTESIESMGARYADEIAEHHPRGPVCVGGWSGGAAVALEVAQQLRARGRTVPLVVALDASPYNTNTGTARTNPMYAWKLIRNLPHWIRDDAMQDGRTDLWERVRMKLRSFREKVSRAGGAEMEGFAAEVGGFFDLNRVSDDQRRFMERYYVALRRYVPKRYDGAVLLFKARTQPLYHLIEPELAWPAITSQLEVAVLPCTHLTIVLEPHVQAIAARVKTRIAQLTAQPVSQARDETRKAG